MDKLMEQVKMGLAIWGAFALAIVLLNGLPNWDEPETIVKEKTVYIEAEPETVVVDDGYDSGYADGMYDALQEAGIMGWIDSAHIMYSYFHPEDGGNISWEWARKESEYLTEELWVWE